MNLITGVMSGLGFGFYSNGISVLFKPIATELGLNRAGASVGALYPLAVGLIGEVLESNELPRGNALTTFAYGIGSIVGPFVPALVMHVTVPKSLFVIAAILYGIVLVTMSIHRGSQNNEQRGRP